MRHWNATKSYQAVRVVAVLLAATSGSASGQVLSKKWFIDARNLVTMLMYVRPALLPDGGAGRIYYSTECHLKDEGPALPFPHLKMQAPARAKTGLQALHEIFENEKSVNILRDQSGMTRITIGKPELAFLQTRIRLLKFTPEQQYTPELAVLALQDPKEVESAMRNLRLDMPVTVSHAGVTTPAKGLPHLPASLKGDTIEEAFDLIAKTFGGIVFFGTCEEKDGTHLITWRFAGASGVAEENLLEQH